MAASVRGSVAFFSSSRKSTRIVSSTTDVLVSWKKHHSRQQSQIVLQEQGWHPQSSRHVQTSNISMRWWEKNIPTTNVIEIRSADELVDSLQSAGDSLVILDFYSPGCGGCRLLRPKISKFKDALAKHGGGGERCSTGTAKGLEESELLSLTANMETHFSYGDAISV